MVIPKMKHSLVIIDILEEYADVSDAVTQSLREIQAHKYLTSAENSLLEIMGTTTGFWTGKLSYPEVIVSLNMSASSIHTLQKFSNSRNNLMELAGNIRLSTIKLYNIADDLCHYYTGQNENNTVEIYDTILWDMAAATRDLLDKYFDNSYNRMLRASMNMATIIRDYPMLYPCQISPVGTP